MTQDFAKRARQPQKKKTTSKPKRNSRRATPKNNKAPAWAWLLIGLLLAALITLLIYLANQPKPDSNTPTQAATPKPTNNKPPQPRFDFYEILKKQEIEVPDRSGEIRAAIPDNITYYLQAGSFRNQDDAEQLRAQLILLNMSANIEPTTNDNGTWYRVIAGPFENRSKMAKARSTLASQGINPLLLKRKTD